MYCDKWLPVTALCSGLAFSCSIHWAVCCVKDDKVWKQKYSASSESQTTWISYSRFQGFCLDYRCAGVWLRAMVGHSAEHWRGEGSGEILLQPPSAWRGPEESWRGLSTRTWSVRTRFKLKKGRFRLNIWNNFFPLSVMQPGGTGCPEESWLLHPWECLK